MLDARLVSGMEVSTDELLRLASEVRRTMTRLGLDADDEGDGIDGTPLALAALRAQHDTEAA